MWADASCERQRAAAEPTEREVPLTIAFAEHKLAVWVTGVGQQTLFGAAA
jgi:hypothetical protein